MAVTRIATLLAAGMLCANVQAYTITDQYIGSNDHEDGDVIGHTAQFDISRLSYSRTSATDLQVRVYTNFVNHIGSYPNADKSGLGRGIGLGDLLLADDWTPVGTAATGYVSDNFADNIRSTHWDWGLALDDRFSATSGSLTLYKLAGPNITTLQSSNDFIKSHYTFRDGQVVAVDTPSTFTNNYGPRGRYYVNQAGGYIQFDMDLSGTNLLNGPEMAFHWAMTCGNDVIEGKGPVPVPEPVTLGLLLLSLLGLGLRRRMRTGSRA
ncbi:MAG: PEP-CTERM sorting domain-containing protein [Gammaproteobacteria bacterium]|nr:MAG: PEP-CTERM sorting domain-containing protein [Gammaproteobacteria bacterium]